MVLTYEKLQGVVAAIVTPFTADDEVDTDGLERLVSYMVKNGVHGIMTTGGNGEFPHLLPHERKKVLEVVVNSVKGKIPVIACTTGCSTKETLLYTKHAEDAGADAVILLPPYYYKLPHEQVFQFYKTVAEKTKLPLIVYNNPTYTGNPIPPKLMVRILSIHGIIGLKQSEYDISQTIEVIRQLGDTVSIMTGIDSQFFPILCVGGRGIFSTAACVVPRHMVEMYDAFRNGNVDKAFRIFMKLQILNRFFEYDPGYVAPCKEALRMLGLPSGHVRSPLPMLSKQEKEQLKEALIQLGLM